MHLLAISCSVMTLLAFLLFCRCAALRLQLDDANAGIVALRATVQTVREKNYESEVRYQQSIAKNYRMQAVLDSYGILLDGDDGSRPVPKV